MTWMDFLSFIGTGAVIGWLSARARIGLGRCVLLLLAALVSPFLWAPAEIFRHPTAKQARAIFNAEIQALPSGTFWIIGRDTVFVYHRRMNGLGVRVGDKLIVTLTPWDGH